MDDEEVGQYADFDDNLASWNGWIDELRVSKGIARWTADFTPPTAAYGVRRIIVGE